MWLIICWCVPQLGKRERQRLFLLLCRAMQIYALEPGDIDMGLVYSARSQETRAALESRRDLVKASHTLLETYSTVASKEYNMSTLARDHIRALLSAELEWLNRVVDSLTPEGPVMDTKYQGKLRAEFQQEQKI
ncbi:hypothetical protein EPA93_01225 [Ktedonosporobacter rubrisoli]|uniref:Uncharacterized protein n=1 Tax=Ktedonosporobacter rubrisoli TaxID=2509675 RepID=A0A4P6JI94_KTERU|nr:hypothetical protein [Ktedonosporobacter rubrisoli]QBD74683.1 hypothetical protein EPA93_01225 [Ktedonosporobacter rubrisoli]